MNDRYWELKYNVSGHHEHRHWPNRGRDIEPAQIRNRNDKLCETYMGMYAQMTFYCRFGHFPM